LNVSSADPRVIKQILLSQWIQNTDPTVPASSSASGNGGMFGVLLNSLLQADRAEAGTEPHPLLRMGRIGGTAAPFDPPQDHAEGSFAFDHLIHAAAARYGLDPALIKGVIQTESGFDPKAVSRAGAKGLMQLMDVTARGLGVTDAFDPAQNIDAGSRFLSYLLRKYDGNVTSALAAYNAGPGRIDRLGLTTDAQIAARMDELPAETQNYLRKVLAAASYWSRQTY